MNSTLREAHSTPYIRSEEAEVVTNDSGVPSGRRSSANTLDEKENRRSDCCPLVGGSHQHLHQHSLSGQHALEHAQDLLGHHQHHQLQQGQLGNQQSAEFGQLQPEQRRGCTVLFNAGCSSSSSTDLSRFMDFYNDSADPDVVAEWMRLYQKQRQNANSTSAHGSASAAAAMCDRNSCCSTSCTSTTAQQDAQTCTNKSCGVPHQHSNDSAEGRLSLQTLHSAESTESLNQSRDSGSRPLSDMQKRSVNRSMDVLPTINEGFYTLGECFRTWIPVSVQSLGRIQCQVRLKL